MKTLYIEQLPMSIQKAIKKELKSIGLTKEDISLAMDSRLCDLEDTINIKPFLKK